MIKKMMKKIFILLVVLGVLFVGSCKKNENGNGNDNPPVVDPDKKEPDVEPEPEHICVDFVWEFEEGTKCNTVGERYYKCVECGKIAFTERARREHDLYYVVVEPTCEEDGSTTTLCHNCDYSYTVKEAATGHQHCHYVIDLEATATETGRRHKECDDCGATFQSVDYAANGFSEHGKLSVEGTNLIDEHGEKFQLVGISTHGIQWAIPYYDYDVIDELHNTFGINVLRLALYTAEGGYCDPSTTETRRKFYYDLVCKAVDICTSLDMYVIVDWHMLGADDPSQGNPLYYKDEAIEFFSKFTEQYKDHENILYEIMNEPCGSTTWAQCKYYAELVIPEIRKNTDAVVLVGNPKWSADLVSVERNPLVGFSNIMYTYHFYANGSFNVSAITRAVKAGLPVFVSEHGGMVSDGDGELDLNSTLAWYRVLEENNISYVAWNLSNTKGSASMMKHGSTDYTNFKDSNLKEWGIWYKNWVRKKFGLPLD